VLECVDAGGGSSGRAAGEQLEEDLLTCGDCLAEFALSDIVGFIRHKVWRCGVGPRCDGVASFPPADHDDEDDNDGVVAGRRSEDRAPAGETLDHGECRPVPRSSPSRHGLLCDSSLPGDDAAAAAETDHRLNGDVDNCGLYDRSTAGQFHTC